MYKFLTRSNMELGVNDMWHIRQGSGPTDFSTSFRPKDIQMVKWGKRNCQRTNRSCGQAGSNNRTRVRSVQPLSLCLCSFDKEGAIQPNLLTKSRNHSPFWVAMMPSGKSQILSLSDSSVTCASSYCGRSIVCSKLST